VDYEKDREKSSAHHSIDSKFISPDILVHRRCSLIYRIDGLCTLNFN